MRHSSAKKPGKIIHLVVALIWLIIFSLLYVFFFPEKYLLSGQMKSLYRYVIVRREKKCIFH